MTGAPKPPGPPAGAHNGYTSHQARTQPASGGSPHHYHAHPPPFRAGSLMTRWCWAAPIDKQTGAARHWKPDPPACIGRKLSPPNQGRALPGARAPPPPPGPSKIWRALNETLCNTLAPHRARARQSIKLIQLESQLDPDPPILCAPEGARNSDLRFSNEHCGTT